MGKGHILQHCNAQGHQDLAKLQTSQTKLKFSAQTSSEALKRTEAEVKMAVLTASCNIPLAFHDRLSPTIRAVFPDSKIASGYHSASTESTPALMEDLLESMKAHPYSLSIDGSNDTDLKKKNPVTVRIYDVNSSRVVTRFLDMCSSSSSTAQGIYSVLDGRLM